MSGTVEQTFTASTMWELAHPWDFNPYVVAVDDNGDTRLVAPDYSPGLVTIHWAVPTAGTLTLIGSADDGEGEGGGGGGGVRYTYLSNIDEFDLTDLFRTLDADGKIRDVKKGYDVELTSNQVNGLREWYVLEEGTGLRPAPEAPPYSNNYFSG